MSDIDWGSEKGIADEPHFDRFIKEFGGKRVGELAPNPTFENADYVFESHSVVAELKILEKEFGDAPEFRAKWDTLIAEYIAQKKMRSPLLGHPYPREYVRDFVELFRPPLARMAKKANRQIKETKANLNMPDARGILICVNDNFRSLEPRFILGLLTRILIGANSAIDGFIYHTNHYVHVPGNEYAQLLWITSYADNVPNSLVEFVDSFGRGWFDFIERVTGPFDSRTEVPHASDTKNILASKAIKPRPR